MTKDIIVAGIKLKNYSVHENLKQVEDNLEANVFTCIEDIYMRTILLAKADEVVKDTLEEMTITSIADVEILDAAGANTFFLQSEIKSKTFFNQLMKRVERSEMQVFVVGGVEKDTKAAMDYLSDEFPRMNLAGYRILDETIASHEDVINEINMIAPDMIVSVLPSPEQEHFLADHKKMLSAQIWYGLGAGSLKEKSSSLSAIFWKKLRQHKLMKYIDSDKE